VKKEVIASVLSPTIIGMGLAACMCAILQLVSRNRSWATAAWYFLAAKVMGILLMLVWFGKQALDYAAKSAPGEMISNIVEMALQPVEGMMGVSILMVPTVVAFISLSTVWTLSAEKKKMVTS